MIFFVGPFPPPTHGMSAINQALYDRFKTEGMGVRKLDTAPRTLRRDLLSRLTRVGRIFSAWFSLLGAQGPRDILYLSLSGGWGQLYDTVSLCIARFRKMQRVIHHHNFAYIQDKRWLTDLLFRIAGTGTLHVVLCAGMARTLQTQYGSQRTLALSNLTLLQPGDAASPRQALRAIGFLSNITKEKGGEIIIDLAQAIKERGMPLGVVVAGPCPEDDLLQKLQRAVSEGALEWRGSTYGADKAKFWTDIDLFVFPSLNEAEPLVIWEALAAGIPVLTYERGCIRDQLEDASVLIPATADFVAPALACLEKWRTSGEEYGLQVRLAQEQYERMKEQSRLQFQELLTSLRKMMA